MRGNTKIGDVFVVNIDDHAKKYFQYIVSDFTQLNSDVIRAFKEVYTIDANPELSKIVNGEVEFYAHCVTKWGVKLGFWERVGNINEVGTFNHILFRDSRDYGKPEIEVSEDWWVWKINEPQIPVGKLTGENQKAEVGLVVTPGDIVTRIKTGQYGFKGYPGY